MSRGKGWHFGVLNAAAKAKPPEEWKTILRSLYEVDLPGAYISKIELAAFVIRGKRIARWKISKSHPEYATLKNSLCAAKKLTWLLLRSDGAPGIPAKLYDGLKCSKTSRCALLEGHAENCITRKPLEETTTHCPICLESIKFNDFRRNGRTDPLSIQMGHLTPLSQARRGHNATNVTWAHRRCNYIQDEQTVEETIRTLREILEKHGFRVLP